jgi:hypothetical protein
MSVYEMPDSDPPNKYVRRFMVGVNADVNPLDVLMHAGVPELNSRLGDDRRCVEREAKRTSPTTWIVTANYQDFDWPGFDECSRNGDFEV